LEEALDLRQSLVDADADDEGAWNAEIAISPNETLGFSYETLIFFI
jgi:hypothetical protein